MPTKERLKRKKVEAQKWAKAGPVPEYMRGASPSSIAEAILTGIGIYEGNLVKFDKAGQAHLHDNVGRGGNDMRHANRCDEAQALRKKYATIWGQRGAAKSIAYNEKLNVRTVQRYIKDFSKK